MTSQTSPCSTATEILVLDILNWWTAEVESHKFDDEDRTGSNIAQANFQVSTNLESVQESQQTKGRLCAGDLHHMGTQFTVEDLILNEWSCEHDSEEPAMVGPRLQQLKTILLEAIEILTSEENCVDIAKSIEKIELDIKPETATIESN